MTQIQRTALVTGGSGFVGSHLIPRLLAEGWQVRAIARSEASRQAVEALGATAHQADLNDPLALERAMAGVDTVFHLAAHFKLWGPRRVFDAINVEGTRHVVTAAARARVRRVVYVSAAAVVMGAPQDMTGAHEGLALHQMGFAPYAASKARAEAVLLAAKGVSTVAIRPPFIWGSDMPALDHMVETVKAGQFQWVGGGRQRLSTCHVDNLCHALILAADRGQGAYFVSDEQDTTLKAFLSRLLAARGVVARDRSVPFGLAWVMAGAMGVVWRALRLRGEPPITRQMLRLIGKDFTLDISKARAELGYRAQITPEAGFAAMGAGPNSGVKASITAATAAMASNGRS